MLVAFSLQFGQVGMEGFENSKHTKRRSGFAEDLEQGNESLWEQTTNQDHLTSLVHVSHWNMCFECLGYMDEHAFRTQGIGSHRPDRENVKPICKARHLA